MSNLKHALLFPGQGAQWVGMGKVWYDAYPVARRLFEEGSDMMSQDLPKMIFYGSEQELSETRNSQPAMFITSLAILNVVRQEFPDLVPHTCAGLSLGEYTALCAAGMCIFAHGMSLVMARGEFMQAACCETQGTMRVVLGLDPEAIPSLLPEGVWIANLNCPGQVVIAGEVDAVARAEKDLLAGGARKIMPLNVSGAFHTPLMKSAQRLLRPQLEAVSLHPSQLRLVMNVTGDYVTSSADIRNHLIDQVVTTTHWERGVRAMEREGMQLYLEIGPGTTLAGMNRKIGTQAPTISVETIEDLSRIEQFLGG